MNDVNANKTIRKSTNRMASSLASSSSSDGIYVVKKNWANINELIDIDYALNCIEDKLLYSINLNCSIIHNDSLSNGFPDLRRMYSVSSSNPMIFGRYSFCIETSYIVRKKMCIILQIKNTSKLTFC